MEWLSGGVGRGEEWGGGEKSGGWGVGGGVWKPSNCAVGLLLLTPHTLLPTPATILHPLPNSTSNSTTIITAMPKGLRELIDWAGGHGIACAGRRPPARRRRARVHRDRRPGAGGADAALRRVGDPPAEPPGLGSQPAAGNADGAGRAGVAPRGRPRPDRSAASPSSRWSRSRWPGIC